MGQLEDLRKAMADRRMTSPDDPEVEKGCPFLWEMLTQDRWGDGSERMLPSIRIERVQGGYMVSLVDDSLCIRKGAVIATLADVAKGLELVLPDEQVPWMPFKSFRNKKGPPIPEEKAPRRKRG